MNEFELRDQLRTKRSQIKTFDDLTDFLKYVEENCNSGYGEAPRAIAQACLAVGWHFADVFGITGFQAGCVMWDFISDWMYPNNKCGLKLVDYDNMLYPQYEYKYQKTITESVWKSLREQAAENLNREDVDFVHPDVLAHWKSIVDGVVPFGYTVVRD